MRRLLLLSILAGVINVKAQTPQPPPPPPPTVPGQPTPGQTVTPPRAGPRLPAAKGTAILRGFVVSADDGSPVRRADVRAFLAQGNYTATATTDAEGRFELRDLPGGLYSLTASKFGYQVPGTGTTPPPRPWRIEVADNAVVEKVQLQLTRGAVITGRIVDDLGDPAVNIDVQALRFSYRDGVRQLTQARSNFFVSVRTDDLGQFRLHGLVPGDYYVAARPQRGPVAPTASALAPALTFFPGTQDLAEARRVAARAGRETGPITFALGLTRVAKVSGNVFGASGGPLIGGNVSLVHRDPIGGSGSSSGVGVRPDGTFEFGAVAPGTYLLVARDLPGGGYGAPPLEVGSMRITVAGEDLSGLAIFTAPAAVVRGRVITDDGTPLPPAMRRTRIETVNVDPSEPGVFGGDGTLTNDDGTFEVKGLFGRRRIDVSRTGEWFTREVRVRGEDVIDTGIEFAPGQVIEDLEIVVTRRATDIRGTVSSGAGQPAIGATVVVFSEDERRWTPRSRFVKSSISGAKGQYGFFALPPADDYLIIALEGLEEGQWADPELLRAVKDQAMRLRIGDGEKKALDLKLAERR